MITFLRDPVERVLSLYDHICRDAGHYQHAVMPPPPDGLQGALQSRLLPPNFQVSSLAHDLDPVKSMAEARRASPDGTDEYSVIYTEMIKRAPTHRDLSVACRRLEEMEFVGIVEQFDESLALLQKTFGWTFSTYRNLNVAPNRTRRGALRAGVLDEIRRNNELDFELYAFAKSLLAKRLDQKIRVQTAEVEFSRKAREERAVGAG